MRRQDCRAILLRHRPGLSPVPAKPHWKHASPKAARDISVVSSSVRVTERAGEPGAMLRIAIEPGPAYDHWNDLRICVLFRRMHASLIRSRSSAVSGALHQFPLAPPPPKSPPPPLNPPPPPNEPPPTRRRGCCTRPNHPSRCIDFSFPPRRRHRVTSRRSKVIPLATSAGTQPGCQQCGDPCPSDRPDESMDVHEHEPDE